LPYQSWIDAKQVDSDELCHGQGNRTDQQGIRDAATERPQSIRPRSSRAGANVFWIARTGKNTPKKQEVPPRNERKARHHLPTQNFSKMCLSIASGRPAACHFLEREPRSREVRQDEFFGPSFLERRIGARERGASIVNERDVTRVRNRRHVAELFAIDERGDEPFA
jgi:hypothetical protein